MDMMTLSPSLERRREPRYPQSLSVNLFDDGDALLCQGVRMQDLSLHGFCFETVAAQFKPGDLFRFSVDIPDHGSVSGEAHVCWCRSDSSEVVCLCGAEIEGINLKNAGRLHSYTAAHN